MILRTPTVRKAVTLLAETALLGALLVLLVVLPWLLAAEGAR